MVSFASLARISRKSRNDVQLFEFGWVSVGELDKGNELVVGCAAFD